MWPYYCFTKYIMYRGISNQPFHSHQQDSSTSKYGGTLVRLVSFLLRAKGEYEMPLPEDLSRNLLLLQQALEEQSTDCKALHSVLLGLWKTRWNLSENDSIPDPTHRFLALYSLQEDGGHADPSAITQVLAQLKWLVRVAFLIDIHIEASGLYDGQLDVACTSLQPWFTDKHYSTFSLLCSLQQRASSIVYATPGLPQIWWMDRDQWSELLFKGDRIRLEDIRLMFTHLENDVVSSWEEKVLLGLKLRVDYTGIHEDLTNKTVGYCFLDDPRNASLKCRSRLLRAIVEDPVLGPRFCERLGDHVEWNLLALREWLLDYARFLRLQLMRCEMLSGGPPRGTELAAMTYRSMASRRQRNLVNLGKHVTLIRTYLKSGALSGVDKLLPHSLDAVTSDLMLQDLLLARPFAEFAVSLCFPTHPEILEMYRYHIFVDGDRLFTTDILSNVMSNYSVRYIGARLTVRSWRHLNVAWRRKLCPAASELYDGAAENMDTVEALQLGHSRSTENRIYGLSADTIDGLAEDILPLFLDVSTHWQMQCHIVPGINLCEVFLYVFTYI